MQIPNFLDCGFLLNYLQETKDKDEDRNKIEKEIKRGRHPCNSLSWLSHSQRPKFALTDMTLGGLTPNSTL